MNLIKKYPRCKKCNRKLRTEEAQIRGYGPHCYKIYLEERKHKSKNLIDIVLEMLNKK